MDNRRAHSPNDRQTVLFLIHRFVILNRNIELSDSFRLTARSFFRANYLFNPLDAARYRKIPKNSGTFTARGSSSLLSSSQMLILLSFLILSNPRRTVFFPTTIVFAAATARYAQSSGNCNGPPGPPRGGGVDWGYAILFNNRCIRGVLVLDGAMGTEILPAPRLHEPLVR